MQSLKVGHKNLVFFTLPIYFTSLLFSPLGLANETCPPYQGPRENRENRCPTDVISTDMILGAPLAGSDLINQITVGSLADTVDLNQDCQDHCTLREAMVLVNHGGTIYFQQGGTLYLSPDQGQLVISKDMVIDGSHTNEPVVIDGNSATRIFYVNKDVHLTLKNLVIANGASAMFPDPSGAGLYNNQGRVYIENCTFRNNDSLPNGYGGAIETYGGDPENFERGRITISNSTFSYNSGEWGGAVDSFLGYVEIINSTFSNNFAVVGGGIFSDGEARIKNATIVANDAAEEGGGISNDGDMEVANSLIIGNTIGQNHSDCSEIISYIASHGFNLVGTGTGCFSLGGQHTDQTIDPSIVFNQVIEPDLANHGGATQTHALLDDPNNPAIDVIAPASSFLFEFEALLQSSGDFDQRGEGFPRVVNVQQDIGAFELQAEPQPHPLSIYLNSFTAEARKKCTRLVWQTSGERDNRSFHLWRATRNEAGQYAEITWLTKAQHLSASGNATQETRYTYLDESVTPDQTYYYLLGSLDTQGDLTLHWDFITSITAH
jgi:CSLREA domain-containing protein